MAKPRSKRGASAANLFAAPEALKPLADKGRIAIERDNRDGRLRRLRLTEDGATILAQAKPIWIALHEKIESELPAALTGDDLRLGLDMLAGFENPCRAAPNAA